MAETLTFQKVSSPATVRPLHVSDTLFSSLLIQCDLTYLITMLRIFALLLNPSLFLPLLHACDYLFCQCAWPRMSDDPVHFIYILKCRSMFLL